MYRESMDAVYLTWKPMQKHDEITGCLRPFLSKGCNIVELHTIFQDTELVRKPVRTLREVPQLVSGCAQELV